ncbi:MAG: hypothetical protein NT056_08435 [Proteobacteria bacterium]|nr:hypothetical protein [Pseudomonadota bacterium]
MKRSRLLNILLTGILFSLATEDRIFADTDAPAGNRVVAAIDKWPITGRDLKLELFFVCLERGGPPPELVVLARNGFAGDVPESLGEELLHKVIERRLILKDMEKARHFQANIEEREVRARLETWDSIIKGQEILAGFSNWLDLDRSELLIQARENLLVEKYVGLELGVFGSTGKKLAEIYNKWANILWNRAEIEIF